MMSIELTVKSAPYQAKIFNKYVICFFQIILSFNKSSTGWYFTAPSPFSERKRKRSRRDRLHMRFFLQIGIKSEIYCLLRQSCFTWMLSTKFSRMLLLTRTPNIILMFSGEAVHCCTLLSDFLKWCWDCWSTQRANDRYKVSYSREVCGSGSGVGV